MRFARWIQDERRRQDSAAQYDVLLLPGGAVPSRVAHRQPRKLGRDRRCGDCLSHPPQSMRQRSRPGRHRRSPGATRRLQSAHSAGYPDQRAPPCAKQDGTCPGDRPRRPVWASHDRAGNLWMRHPSDRWVANFIRQSSHVKRSHCIENLRSTRTVHKDRCVGPKAVRVREVRIDS